MSAVRTTQSLEILRQTYNGNAELTLTSIQLRKEQKEMLEALARRASESQASILRAIIDEWREMKLRDC